MGNLINLIKDILMFLAVLLELLFITLVISIIHGASEKFVFVDSFRLMLAWKEAMS